MIMPEFENFCDSLSVALMREKFYFDLVSTSAVRVKNFPHTDFTALAKEFIKHPTFEIAREQNSVVEGIISSYDYNFLPKTEITLVQMWNDLRARNDIFVNAAKVMLAIRASMKEGVKKIDELKEISFNFTQFASIKNLDPYIEEHNELVRNKEAIVRINNYELLSQMIGGFNKARIGILMGGTGYGKSQMSLSLGLSAAETMGALYVNLELSFLDIVRRAIVIRSGMTYKDLYKNEITTMQHRQLPERLFVTDGSKMSLNEIKILARKMKKENDIKLIIVDYDQKIDLNYSSREPEWKQIQNAIEELEELAKHLECYILVCAQMNRDGQISASHRSQFSAHTVLNFYDHPQHGPIVSAVKNRHGKKGRAVRVMYNEENAEIKEIEVVNLFEEKTNNDQLLSKETINHAPYRMPYKD